MKQSRSYRRDHATALEVFEEAEGRGVHDKLTTDEDASYERSPEGGDRELAEPVEESGQAHNNLRRPRTIRALLGLGSFLVVSGGGLMVIWNISPYGAPLRELFGGSGFAPIDLVLLGLVLAGISTLRTNQWRQHDLLASAIRQTDDHAALPNLPSQIGFLVETAKTTSAQQLPELNRVLERITQQEERLASLSGEIQMYNQPLLEITTQVSRADQQISGISGQLAAVQELAERIEAATANADVAPDLTASLNTHRENLAALQRELASQLSEKANALLADVTEALQRSVTEEVNALASRLGADSSEQLATTLANLERQIERMASGEAHQAAAPAEMAAPPTPTPAPPPSDSESKSSSSSVMSAIAKLKQLRT